MTLTTVPLHRIGVVAVRVPRHCIETAVRRRHIDSVPSDTLVDGGVIRDDGSLVVVLPEGVRRG